MNVERSDSDILVKLVFEDDSTHTFYCEEISINHSYYKFCNTYANRFSSSTEGDWEVYNVERRNLRSLQYRHTGFTRQNILTNS